MNETDIWNSQHSRRLWKMIRTRMRPIAVTCWLYCSWYGPFCAISRNIQPKRKKKRRARRRSRKKRQQKKKRGKKKTKLKRTKSRVNQLPLPVQSQRGPLLARHRRSPSSSAKCHRTIGYRLRRVTGQGRYEEHWYQYFESISLVERTYLDKDSTFPFVEIVTKGTVSLSHFTNCLWNMYLHLPRKISSSTSPLKLDSDIFRL